MIGEPLAVTLEVIQAFNDLRIPYLLGGSLASAIYGVLRATLDSDLVADPDPDQAAALVQTLSSSFYVTLTSVAQAIEQRTHFSVIHLESIFKVDVFVSQRRAFDRMRFQRRRLHVVATDPDRALYVSSAEDTILAKLEWYRMGGEVSERQWRDVLGMLKVQGRLLERAHLAEWAQALGVADLLETAFLEAEIGFA